MTTHSRDKKTPARQLAAAKARRRAQVHGLGPRQKDGAPRPFFPEQRKMSPAPRVDPRKTSSPPEAAILALTRMGFGPSPSSLADFQTLGATDAQRFQAYVEQQLDPDSIDDGAADARLAQSGFTTLGKSVPQLWADHFQHEGDWSVVMQPFFETIRATWVRAIHSKRQLFELMVDFWHNHFNVYADDVPFGPVWPHTDRDAIRANALGNFREMVEAVTKTPAMLFYLDNAFNSSEDANENFARELLELHVMGAESYLGSVDPASVPLDDNGVPVGYTEADVVEVARCLTGWTMKSDWVHWEFEDTGEFFYHAPWHDTGAKRVIGLDIPANQGDMQDGRDMLDWICAHPATAHFVALKMCRRVMADFPPEEVVDAAAATFLAHVGSTDQIAQVLRTILLHPLYLQTWGDKVKRPFEAVVSMFRGAGMDLAFNLGDEFTNWFLWEFIATGQPLFSWHPPNGYPDTKFAWNTTSPRVMTWRMANMLVGLWDEANDDYLFDFSARTPAGVRTAREIVDHWAQEILGRSPSESEQASLLAFMAQGASPDVDLPELGTDWETDERLRTLIALIMMCPSFLVK